MDLIVFTFSAVDMIYGMVSCFACGDYVYDKELDNLAKKLSQRSSSLIGKIKIYITKI